MQRAPALVITLNRDSALPLRRQIRDEIRRHVISGLLKAGDAIPPSRALAEQLGVSRTVVVQAYEQLHAEGLLGCVQGSGTFISHGLPPSADPPAPLSAAADGPRPRRRQRTALPTTPAPAPAEAIPYDFRHGVPAWDRFPIDAWRRLLMRVCAHAGPATLGYGPAEGSPLLREALAGLLRHTRGVAASIGQLVITTGATQALDLVARTQISKGDLVFVEDPTHPVLREIFHHAGARILPVAVDQEGLCIDELDAALRAQGARAARRANKLVYVTPSHQFPSGVTMSLARKTALLDWARRTEALIIEDDYDSDYRFDGPRLPALAGLDAERVIYVGSFSKVLFPALRIGYAHLPSALTPSFVAVKWLADRLTATLEQEVLARFIHSGQYASHIRRMTRLYTARRAALAAALREAFAGRCSIEGIEAGLHILITLDSQATESAIARHAEALGVRIYPASPYYARPTDGRARFLLGYGALSEKQLAAGIRLLARAERRAAAEC